MGKNIAIILAAGSGTRFGAGRPKQFLMLGGRTILEHSIAAFEQSTLIGRIVVVTREDCIEEVRRLAAPFAKVTDVIAGGRERYESSINALAVCTEDDDYLLFHDAVRPYLSELLIERLINAGKGRHCVAAALPATDTIVRADAEGHLVETLRRSELWAMQTPQCFPRNIIAEAYRLCMDDPDFFPTDDCGVVMRYMPHVPITLIEGESTNVKITYRSDLKEAQI